MKNRVAPGRLLTLIGNDRKGFTVRLQFQQNLGDLKDRVLVMAGMAEQAIRRAVDLERVDNAARRISDHGSEARM
jgi:hypothetical protein